MARSVLAERKHRQKENNLLKNISQLFLQIAQDEPTLQLLSISKVVLSPSKGLARVYFYTSGGLDRFKELLKTLVLYKPSMRNALSKLIPGRRIPDLKFVFDGLFEKRKNIDDLLIQVGNELKDRSA